MALEYTAPWRNSAWEKQHLGETAPWQNRHSQATDLPDGVGPKPVRIDIVVSSS
jgi:hypothetical protein